jgi:hypothetical protein
MARPVRSRWGDHAAPVTILSAQPPVFTWFGSSERCSIGSGVARTLHQGVRRRVDSIGVVVLQMIRPRLEESGAAVDGLATTESGGPGVIPCAPTTLLDMYTDCVAMGPGWNVSCTPRDGDARSSCWIRSSANLRPYCG